MSVRNNLLKAVDASVGALICHVMRLSPRAVNHAETFPDVQNSSVKRILLIRPGGMGDMILLKPVIRQLKKTFADAQVDIVCEKRNIEVLEIEGFEGSTMTYDRMSFRFLTQLLRRRYDIAIDTEQFHHFSAVFAFLSGAPVRVGFKINPRRNPLYTHLVNYSLEGYEGDQFMNLIEAFVESGCSCDLEGSIDGGGSDLLKESIRDKVDKLSKYMIIHPGTSTRYKRWETEKYIKVSECLISKYGVGLIFVGDASDSGNAEEIMNGLSAENRDKCVSAAGIVDLSSAAALIKKAALFIGSDSGLTHLAAALGVKTVTIFGPSDYRKWGSKGAKHAVVRKDLPCSPCSIFGYNKPCETIACMKQVTPEDVLQAVDSLHL